MATNRRSRRRTMWPDSESILEALREDTEAKKKAPFAEIKEIQESLAKNILNGFLEMELTAKMVIPDGATEFPDGFDLKKSDFNFLYNMSGAESATPLDYITWVVTWLKASPVMKSRSVRAFGKPDEARIQRLFVQHYYGYGLLSFYSLKNRIYDKQLQDMLKRFWMFCRLHDILDESLYKELPIHEKLTQKWHGDVNEYLWLKHANINKSEMVKQMNAIKETARGPWNRCKLMVVGQGRAGKTATIRNMLGKDFDATLESTVGAELTQTTTFVGGGRNGGKSRGWDEESALRYEGFLVAQIAAAQVQPPGMHEAIRRERLNSQYKPNRVEAKRQAAFLGLDQIHDSDDDDDEVLTSEERRRRDVAKARYSRLAREARRKHKFKQEMLAMNNHTLKENTKDDDESNPRSMAVIRKFGPGLMDLTGRGLLSFTIWDYGGQEVFLSLHNLFLSSQGVYMIVFSMLDILEDAKSQASLNFWLNSVKLHAPQAPMFLVGTFLDKVDLNRVNQINQYLREELAGRFPKIVKPSGCNFFPMNNKKPQTAAELRQEIEAAALIQDYVRQPVPVRWTKWLDFIKSPENGQYVKYSQLLKTTTKHGIPEEEVDEMLSVFHRLGALLRFTKTEALREVVVLDPQWILSSMSKVIRDKNLHPYDLSAVKAKGLEDDMRNLLDHGLASRDFLEYLWQGSNVEFLIDLMKMTLLLSEWYVQQELTYIVPSMIRQARLTTPTRQGASMVLDFSKSFLPRGVFQRLVCLCIVVSPGRLTSSLPLPQIHESSARIELGGVGMIMIEEIGRTIIVSMLQETPESTPQSIPQLFRVMLRKLQNEIFSDRLSWETYYSREDSKTDIPEEEAVKLKLSPWFSKPLRRQQKRNSTYVASMLDLSGKHNW